VRSKFITFEGTDGSGKSTQIRRLADYCKGRGMEIVLTREPGGTPLAEEIRSLLLDPEKKVVGSAEVLLYAAARAQHVEQLIKPALAAGKTVLCDRFADSTVAYQGFGRGLPIETVMAVNNFAAGGLEPDLTIVLDLSYDQARARIAWRIGQGSIDRIEQEEAEFHCRVREGYLWLREKLPDRVRFIDASLPQRAVFDKIVAELKWARLID
jgi:dTMP kinase